MFYLNNNKGIALVMVLLMLLVVGVLSGALLLAYNSNISQSRSFADRTKAFYAAEAGINISDQVVEKFNYVEGNLGIHTDYHYRERLNKLDDELSDFINENSISLDNYSYEFEITEKNLDDYFLTVQIRAINKASNTIEEIIESEYKMTTTGFGGFFAHTLAANEIEINGDAEALVESLLFDSWSSSGGWFSNTQTATRDFKSDITGDIKKIATAQSVLSDLGDHNFCVERYRERANWWSSWGPWQCLDSKTPSEVIEFYGEEDNPENLYLPSNEDAEEFTDYVNAVNFIEVLKQNNVNLTLGNMNTNFLFDQFKSFRDSRNEDYFNYEAFLDQFDNNYNSENDSLAEYLNGYYENMEDLRVASGDYGSNNSPEPYIYVNEFDFNESNNDLVDFTNFNTVHDVVHLYINDNIDFSDKNNDILFTSYNEKSVLVQSGGNEINLAGNRILYRTGGAHLMQGIAYYAPNATMYMSGDMPGTGWGQSYNVNKIIMEDNLTFPPFVYDPEESGFIGNIHSDIASYLGGDDQVGDYSAGEISRSKWKLIR